MLENIDLDLLLKARLWVARFGESDVHGWWRTVGMLGPEPDGAYVGPRVLPRTHPTGRARIAFAIAAHACDQRHPDPNVVHLFRLTADIEDRFDALLAARLADTGLWGGLMPKLEAVRKGAEIAATLAQGGVVTTADLHAVAGRPLGPAGRSLAIVPKDPGAAVGLLAAGFSRSQPGSLAVPYLETRAG